MTPEERAKALYDYLSFAPTDKWEANILAAIREAVAAGQSKKSEVTMDEKDITERLRESALIYGPGYFQLEAADEIKRLRAKIAALEHASGLTRMGREVGAD